MDETNWVQIRTERIMNGFLFFLWGLNCLSKEKSRLEPNRKRKEKNSFKRRSIFFEFFKLCANSMEIELEKSNKSIDSNEHIDHIDNWWDQWNWCLTRIALSPTGNRYNLMIWNPSENGKTVVVQNLIFSVSEGSHEILSQWLVIC